MTEDDFNNYKNLCSKLDSSITLMKNKNDFNSTIDFDINEWNNLSLKFKEAINSNLKDLLKKDNNSWEEAKTWEKICNALKIYYSKLATEYIEAKYYYAESLVAENNNQKKIISKLEGDIKVLKQDLNTTKAELNKFKTDNTNFGNNLQKAFEVCVFLPLAVKYNKDYVDYAYLAANEIICSPQKGNIDPRMRPDWYNYSPLLKNYGKYNSALENFINNIKNDKMLVDKKISKEEVEQIIGRMKFNETNPDLVEYMIKYYQNDVSITYLDYVIEEFLKVLNDYAATGKEITDKLFTNFINIHLK